MKSTIKEALMKIGWSATLATAVFGANLALISNSQGQEPKKEQIVRESKQAGKDVSSIYKITLPSYRCAQFTRVAADQLFGLKYQPANAWDRRYVDDVISLEGESLEKRFEEGILKPGMQIGLRNPRSLFLKQKDSQGNDRLYTHVALCIGKDMFAHQYGRRIRVDSEESLKQLGLSPIEILAARGN